MRKKKKQKDTIHMVRNAEGWCNTSSMIAQNSERPLHTTGEKAQVNPGE